MKEDHTDEAKTLFSGSKINITTSGRRLLGAAIATQAFITDFVSEKAAEFSERLNSLAELAKSQPQAAYAVFTRCLSSEWKFISRVMKDTSSQLDVVKDAIRRKFLPALTGRQTPGDTERDLLALSVRHRGLGVGNPVKCADIEYRNSLEMVAPLTELLVRQQHSLEDACDRVVKERNRQRIERARAAKEAAQALLPRLSMETRRAVEMASERGASTWLTTSVGALQL